MTATAQQFAPYRGLAPFGESELDALLFFGRERETEIATANLIGARLTVLYGPSGVGKSSLLRAGVARRVRELGRSVARGPDTACVVFSSWAERPLEALGHAIAAEVAPVVSPTAPEPPEGATLADLAEHWTALLDGDLCLVLDQLEEYFVYHGDERGPDSLLAQLPELVSRPGLRANVLLSLRDDELARLDVLQAGLPNVFANALRLDRLTRDAARAAILGPLERWNERAGPDERVDVELELVEDVLDQSSVSGTGGVEAPYLQLVMERVWDEERARGSRLLRRATLAGLGGAEAIVREHLDRALAVLDPAGQETAARMFDHLVTPSGSKIAHRATDLAAFAHVRADEAGPVLATLGRERILRHLDDAAEGEDRYEIFHDVLAQAVLDWRRRRDLDVEREAARRRQRRLVQLAAAALVGLAVFAGIALYAIAQRGDARSQARQAGASALAAGALAELETDPELSLLLASEAARRVRSRANEDVLRKALVSSRARGLLRGHEGGVVAVGYAPGRIATLDGAGTLRTFPPRTAPAASERRLGPGVTLAAFSADGDVVAVARRQLVRVRRVDFGASGFEFDAGSPVLALATDAAGAHVATATLDGRLTVWSAAGRGFEVRPSFAAKHLALDEGGTVLAAAGEKLAAVWRVGRARPIVALKNRRGITGVALAPDGKLLATGDADGVARLRNVPGGDLFADFVEGSPLTGVAFSRDGALLSTLSAVGSARVYEITGRPVSLLAGHADGVTSVAFGPDARMIVSGSPDGTARVWDTGAAPELRVVARPPGCCVALASSPIGTVVAAGRGAILYRDGAVAARFDHGAPVTSVAASDVVVTGGADGRVLVWAPDGSRRLTLDLGAPVTAVAAAADRIAAADGDGAVRVWTEGGRRVAGFVERGPVAALGLSPDGELIATGGLDRVARLREAGSGRLLHSLAGHELRITGVAFSPDGSLLATSSADHDVRLWHVETGRPGRVFPVHTAIVSAVGFSPDGRWLVSAGPIAAGLWRTDTEDFGHLRGPEGKLVGAAFTADGTRIVTASIDGTVRSYRCETCARTDGLLALARRRLAATGRSLTPAERKRYLP